MAKYEVLIQVGVELDADNVDDAEQLATYRIINNIKDIFGDDPELRLWTSIDDVVELEGADA